MNVPPGFDVGVCSHTGFLRSGNEDDYLLAGLPGGNTTAFFAAIADGMGGVAGGAEASRTALRALASVLLDHGSETPVEVRMRAGFHLASARVFESATAVPALRDMGTTMTSVWLSAGSATVGHVGDSRLYRLRGGRCELLTEDHSIGEGQNLLTRCIGGGQMQCEVDQRSVAIEPADRFVLVTDGVWNVLTEDEFAGLAAGREPQATAEMLVQRALDHGGPDNATVVIVDCDPVQTGGDVDLPRHERPEARALWPRPVSLRPPIWPWLVLAGAVALLAWSGLRLAGIDLLHWLGGF